MVRWSPSSRWLTTHIGFNFSTIVVNGNVLTSAIVQLIVFLCFQGGGTFWQPDHPSQHHGKLAQLHGHFLTTDTLKVNDKLHPHNLCATMATLFIILVLVPLVCGTDEYLFVCRTEICCTTITVWVGLGALCARAVAVDACARTR